MATVTRPIEKRLLLKRQRNVAFATILEEGRSPVDFAWAEVLSPGRHGSHCTISRLVLGGTEFYFDFDPVGSGVWNWACTPGDNEPSAEGNGDWPDVLDWFRVWLRILGNEVDAPDLWSGDILAGVVVETGDGMANERLTEPEMLAIERRVAAVRAFVLNSGVQGEQLQEIHEKLDYLVAATKRVGRYDWRNLAIGVVIDIAIAAAFNPQQAQSLLNLLVGTAQRLIAG